MKYAVLFFLAASSCAFAQDTVRTNVLYQTSGAGVVTAGSSGGSAHRFRALLIPPQSPTNRYRRWRTAIASFRTITVPPRETPKDERARTQRYP